jgi:glycosyltransferase involved in cell wall biosynthesis
MIENSELISIVTPVYNCVAYLRETVKCVQEQSYSNWEMLLINDGSTDGSGDLVEQLALEDSRIKAIHQTNSKQGKARNNGIKHASGEWIAFLDADDLWPRGKLDMQLRIALSSGADLTFTDGFICLNNQMELREHRFGVEDKLFLGENGVKLFHAQNRIPTSSVLAKKAALQSVGGFPENSNVQNCEDYLLWVKLLTEGYSLLGVSEPLLFYRVHPYSATSSETKALFPLIEALLEIPGGKTIERNGHLKDVFKKLVFRLNELGELKSAEVFISRVIDEVYGGWEKALLKMAWKSGPSMFIRVFWRLSGGHQKK